MRRRRAPSQADDPLRRWLRAHDYWVTSAPGISVLSSAPRAPERPAAGERRPLTHVFLNGGKASVPDAARADFALEYANCLLAGHAQHVVERIVGDRFRMFADIDFGKDDAALDVDVERVVLEVLRAMPLDADAVVLLRKSPSVETTSDDRKRGAHIVWQGENAHVDRARALRLRQECVRACGERGADGKPPAWWTSVVDPAVYKSGSLRMLGSRKADSAAVYLPTHEWTSEGNASGERRLRALSAPYHEDLVTWLDRCSVHVPSGPAASTSDPLSGTATANREEKKESAAAVELALSAHVPELRELWEALPEPYRSCKVMSMRASSGQTTKNRTVPRFTVLIDCRHCLNYQREHRSNHVYLVVERSGVFQRCFCTCETTQGRLHGLCRDAKEKLLARPPPGFKALLEREHEKVESTAASAMHLATAVATNARTASAAKLDDLARRVERRLGV